MALTAPVATGRQGRAACCVVVGETAERARKRARSGRVRGRTVIHCVRRASTAVLPPECRRPNKAAHLLQRERSRHPDLAIKLNVADASPRGGRPPGIAKLTAELAGDPVKGGEAPCCSNEPRPKAHRRGRKLPRIITTEKVAAKHHFHRPNVHSRACSKPWNAQKRTCAQVHERTPTHTQRHTPLACAH